MGNLRVVVAAALVAVLVAGCGPGRRVVEGTGTTAVRATEGSTGSGTSNEQKARAEAERLLGSVDVPPGSVRWTGPPPSPLSGPAMGTPATTSLIDDEALWKVPRSLNATLAWFAEHPPGGLSQSGSGSSSSQGTTMSAGLSYDVPPTGAWTDASVQIGVAPAGSDTSFVRADGIASWIDPVPLRDTQSGPRMRLTLTTGCPASDQGFVGVTNPPPALDSALLPAESPTGGLGCQYYGMNIHPSALEQKTVMDSAAASAFARGVGQLPLGHVDGQVTSCPADEGSVTVVALVYPDGRTVDLWMATTGCPEVSNGYITTFGTVPV